MNIKWSFLPIFSLLLSFNANAGCIDGNCHDGKGVYKYPSGAIFDGNFKGGKIAEYGTLYFSNGNVYTGQWSNQYREGKGELEFSNGDLYQGGFQKGKFQGKGVMQFSNGDRYDGDWVADQMYGKGLYAYHNGDVYDGDFFEGAIHGYGTMKYHTGSVYEGNWENNLKSGDGVYRKTNGEKVSGVWRNGKFASKSNSIVDSKQQSRINTPTSSRVKLRDCNNQLCKQGSGQFVYMDGSRWVGEFVNGKPHGKGICYYANGDKYDGGWANHSPHGEGVMYYTSGKVYGAKWNYGRPLEQIEEKKTKYTYQSKVTVDNSSEVKVWAVVVGVAGYTHMPSLKYTDDDAYQIYAFLKSPKGGALPDNQIKVLVDDIATKENILKAMNQTFMKADKNDVVLLYFSGHGLNGSFLPFDYDGYRNKLMHTEIQQIFDRSQAKHKICFADACHSGSMLASKSSAETIDNYYGAFKNTEGGTALLLSSKASEFSLEDLGLRQGIYSHFLIKGLKGEADVNNNGIVTVKELFNFVHKRVTRYTNYVQTPTLTGNFDADMPVSAVR